MDIYREEILEQWKNPSNYGEMKHADLIIDQVNPLCGDEVRFFFKITKEVNPKIQDVTFVGNGCAISIASASVLSTFVKGKSLRILERLTGEKVLQLLGGPVTPARLKCAFLSLEAVKKLDSLVVR